MSEPTDEILRIAAFEAKFGSPDLRDMTYEELERELELAEIALAKIEIEEVNSGLVTPEQLVERDRRYQ